MDETLRADVAVILAAADRCAGACLEHVGEPCRRWVDVVPQRTIHRPLELHVIDDEGEWLLQPTTAGDD